MRKEKISFKETGNFSKKFLDFINGESESYFPSEKNILSVQKNLNFSFEDRALLYDDLKSQYKGIEVLESVNKNLELLKSENTYTITTGHQLNIFTGPMYVIYKIVSAIKLSADLSKKYPENNFIPVYWMASEDHDFEEIQSFHTRGKTYKWDIESRGPVGNLKLESIESILKQDIDIPDFFVDAYQNSKSLSESVRKYMNSLFGKFGLIIIDPNSKNLKSTIKDIMEDDIINNSIEKIEKSSESSSDVYVRKINFFFQKSDFRERIEKSDTYNILSSELSFSEEEIKNKIQLSPESFSPNVITRCLYQQRILPNICYVGGPAEIIYWTSFKKFFSHYKVPYPVLVPRDFILLLTTKAQKKIEKLKLSTADLFLDKDKIENKVMSVYTDDSKNFSREIKEVKKILEGLSEKFGIEDSTMKPHVLATAKNIEKRLLQIERRYINKQKENSKFLIDKVGSLFNFINPGNSIQERRENIISFYDSELIDNLFQNLDPLDLNFKILKK